jgi:hypothetical protein
VAKLHLVRGRTRRNVETHVFVDVAGETFRASSQQLDEKAQHQLGRVVLRAHQQQRLLQFLDVELEQIKGLPEKRESVALEGKL